MPAQTCFLPVGLDIVFPHKLYAVSQWWKLNNLQRRLEDSDYCLPSVGNYMKSVVLFPQEIAYLCWCKVLLGVLLS